MAKLLDATQQVRIMRAASKKMVCSGTGVKNNANESVYVL